MDGLKRLIEKTVGDDMITCSVCGCLNDSSRATCIECGSDLSDSPDWGVDYEDDDDFDEDNDIVIEDDNDNDTSCDFGEDDDFDDGDYDNSEDMGYYDDSYYD